MTLQRCRSVHPALLHTLASACHGVAGVPFEICAFSGVDQLVGPYAGSTSHTRCIVPEAWLNLKWRVC